MSNSNDLKTELFVDLALDRMQKNEEEEAEKLSAMEEEGVKHEAVYGTTLADELEKMEREKRPGLCPTLFGWKDCSCAIM